MAKIALIPGDGIGVEVTAEARRVLEAVSEANGLEMELAEYPYGAERYLSEGLTLTDEEFQDLAEHHSAILLGALGDPRVPSNVHTRDILLGLRFKLDLFVNYRPCSLLAPELSPLRNAEPIQLHIFRENTEGLYVGVGGSFKYGTEDEVAIQESVNTRKGVERIIRAAFDFAVDRGLDQVTMVDKANAMTTVGGLWRRVFSEVADAYWGVKTETMYVDAMAMDLVRRPERYSVIVTSNLFGDILSDLAAEITGGLGLAPSANLNPGRHGLFEPVHGSAPDIAGKGIANPVGAIRCVSLLLQYLGLDRAAASVESAVQAAFEAGVRTPDVGGNASTSDVGSWVADRLNSVAVEG